MAGEGGRAGLTGVAVWRCGGVAIVDFERLWGRHLLAHGVFRERPMNENEALDSAYDKTGQAVASGMLFEPDGACRIKLAAGKSALDDSVRTAFRLRVSCSAGRKVGW